LLFVPGPQLNAFAVGSREQPMIGVTQGLLRSLDNRELTAVLAHEIAHIQNNDLRVMGLANAMTRLTSLLSFFGLLLLFFSIPAMWFAGQTVPVTLILLLVMAPVLHRLMLLALSRTREFDADLGAALLTNDPRGLAQALQKIDYFTNGWFRSLFWPSGQRQPQASVLLSHPPTAERVQRLLDIADDRGYEWESRSRIREVVLFSHNLFSTPRLRRRRIRWY
jgi:heat shock protein HtpX